MEPKEEEEEKPQAVDLNDVIQRLDNLKLQVRVIDSNVRELSEEAQKMSDTMIQINHTMNIISHNLIAFFNS